MTDVYLLQLVELNDDDKVSDDLVDVVVHDASHSVAVIADVKVGSE